MYGVLRMKNFVSILLVIFISFGMFLSDAHAKRFGGGRSFGVSRSVSSFSRSTPAASPFQRSAAPRGNRWLAPLAGLAAGGLLASLFMGHGFASGMMSWLLVAGIVMLLLNLLRSLKQNRMQPAAPIYNLYHDSVSTQQSASPYAPANNYLSGFDEADFLRTAKVQFIRLQAAYDQKNLQDIRQFTTPEVYAEIKLDLQERGDKINQTDVVTLEAMLLDAANENNSEVASVEFSGLIREEIDQAAAPFSEVWHFVREKNGDGWMTAGIQQNR
jgi:predicted lipid-binding transport protein (Tim44 family)